MLNSDSLPPVNCVPKFTFCPQQDGEHCRCGRASCESSRITLADGHIDDHRLANRGGPIFFWRVGVGNKSTL